MSQKFLLVLNLISLLVIFGIIATLVNFNNRISNLEMSLNIAISNIADNKENSNKPTQIQRNAINKDLKITDQGYSPSGFQIYSNQITTVTVLNIGELAHSFVIDELNIDSGIIEPGQIKEIIIDQNSAESKNYTFYSNAEGDDPETFTGVMMVLK